MDSKKALVLSGGSIKGAFQAGALAELLESGFVPDLIYGTSVGSLNGAFLADRAGRAVRRGEEPDWPELGQELEKFWLSQLHSPSQVATQRGLVPLLVSLLRQTFNGLIDTSPLRSLVEQELDPENLRASPAKFFACAVNLVTGEAIYASEDYSGILDYIMASTAIPIEMPYVSIGKSPYVDGGVREVAPLKPAIEDGAEEIVCILCQPRELQGVSFNPGNLLEYAFRLMEVVTTELINNDIDRFRKVNRWVETFNEMQRDMESLMSGQEVAEADSLGIREAMADLPFKEWRRIPMTVIRPDNEIVLDLLHFTPVEIEEVIKQGRNIAKKELEAASRKSEPVGGTGAAETPQ
jgi:NTE family protein